MPIRRKMYSTEMNLGEGLEERAHIRMKSGRDEEMERMTDRTEGGVRI